MHNNNKSWSASLVALSIVIMGVTALPLPSMATGVHTTDPARFTCRASVLRANQLLGITFEPIVANPAEDPCKTDNKVLLDVILGTLPLNTSNIVVLGAVTEDTTVPVSSHAFAIDANILNLINVDVLESTAKIKRVNGQCLLTGESSVASAVVNGVPYDLISTPLDIPIPGVGKLHFNKTLKPSANKLIQRAVWLEITNPLLQSTTGMKEVIVGEAIVDYEGGNPCADIPPTVNKRRMTGGGKFTDGNKVVTHGFVLHCNVARTPNNLQINWSGNKFHLDNLTSASCSDNPSIDAGKPVTNFDTIKGKGTGQLNGIPGATAQWLFTDAGEPGEYDTASVIIKDNNGNVILNISETDLIKGNHQAHPN